jgi:uncharacterized protein YeaO (DUF488 family)
MVKLKRVYAAPDSRDGYRVLVDRLWPRGVSKEKAHIELWMKEIAPSDRLRKWFAHDPERWDEFQKRYREELRTRTGLIKQLRQLEKKHRTLTLTYGAHDEEHNQAVVLRSVLEKSD